MEVWPRRRGKRPWRTAVSLASRAEDNTRPKNVEKHFASLCPSLHFYFRFRFVSRGGLTLVWTSAGGADGGPETILPRHLRAEHDLFVAGQEAGAGWAEPDEPRHAAQEVLQPPLLDHVRDVAEEIDRQADRQMQDMLYREITRRGGGRERERGGAEATPCCEAMGGSAPSALLRERGKSTVVCSAALSRPQVRLFLSMLLPCVLSRNRQS